MRRAVSVVIIGLIAFAVVAGAARSADLQIALSSEPNSMDPRYHALAPNNRNAARIFEALSRRNPQNVLSVRSTQNAGPTK